MAPLCLSEIDRKMQVFGGRGCGSPQQKARMCEGWREETQ